MPITYPYLQYGGIWTTSQATDAVASGTWPIPPTPKLFSWGSNGSGQLGLGNTTYYSSPKQVGSLTTWLYVASGIYSGYSIKTDGTLWSWGSNAYGNLGTSNTTNYSSPKQVGALTNWSKVASKGTFCVAIKTDGTLWGWGQNDNGQLGLNNLTYAISSPTQIGALTTWSWVDVGYLHTIATKTDGTLWSWGSGATYGALGLGNTTRYSSPKQVGSLTNWLYVACGRYFSLASKTDGTLWTWGQNNGGGQLGLGDTTNRSSPVQIGTLTNWSLFKSGLNSTISTKTDGTLWSWGANSLGELGQGNITNYSSPKQVGSLTNWYIVACGHSNGLSIKTDGTLWSWGRNQGGQLGLGNTTYTSSPQQVGSLVTWSAISGGRSYTLAIAKT